MYSDNVNKKQKILIFADLDLLFDFKSILIAITRFFIDNSEKYKTGNLNGKFFQTIDLITIQQFVDDVIEKIEFKDVVDLKRISLKNELKAELLERICLCQEFKCVKPRLFFVFRFYYLIGLLKEKFSSENIQINISSSEEYFIRMMEDTNILKKIKNLFQMKEDLINLISRANNKIVEEFEDKINLKIQNFSSEEDNKSPTIIFNSKNISFDLIEKSADKTNNFVFYFYPNIKIDEKEKLSNKENFKHLFEFEAFLKEICENFNMNDFESELKKYQDSLKHEFIEKYSSNYLNHDYKFINLWKNFQDFNKEDILAVEGKVIPGFKRGSKLLGVPTANIDVKQGSESNNLLKNLLNGIYYGNYKFLNKDDQKVYKSVLSIGYNPYFDNSCKTLEVFLIDYEGEDFYDSECLLTIEGFVRNEAAFENFSELVTAINYDIIVSYYK